MERFLASIVTGWFLGRVDLERFLASLVMGRVDLERFLASVVMGLVMGLVDGVNQWSTFSFVTGTE